MARSPCTAARASEGHRQCWWPCFEGLLTATSPDSLVMGIRHREHPIEGIQFHPESILTEDGMAMLGNWLRSLRG